MKNDQSSHQETIGINLPKGLSQPAIRALVGAGYTRLEQLNGVPEAEILRLHGMGRKGIDTLRQALAAEGMAFGDEKTVAK